MDGNGRWAHQHGVPISEGHKAGADTVKARLRDAVDLGVRELTLYSFSTENWIAPQDEVDALMALFSARIIDETPELHEEGVKMRFVGRREGVLPGAARADGVGGGEDRREHAASRCSSPSTTAGASEILDAAERYTGGGEEAFRQLLYAPEMHDPDLLIRTSGEQRISNYLLWQAAYSELHFTDVLWPDFSRADFEEALASYEARVRRFGGAEMAARGARASRARRAPRTCSRGSWSRSRRSRSRSLIIWQGEWVFAAGIGALARGLRARADGDVRARAAGAAGGDARRARAGRWRARRATSGRSCSRWSRPCR